MHGNVWEWCEDIWHENYNGAPTDGSSWLTGGDQNRRAMRGGSWVNNDFSCRSALRFRYNAVVSYSLGFRVVCSAVEKPILNTKPNPPNPQTITQSSPVNSPSPPVTNSKTSNLPIVNSANPKWAAGEYSRFYIVISSVLVCCAVPQLLPLFLVVSILIFFFSIITG
jgi:hypothetical protein